MSNISIVIRYRPTDSDEWMVLHLRPEEYFDQDPGETLCWDSVPVHEHACDYLPLSPSNLRHTQLEIIETNPQVKKVIHETFWNEGRNRVIERIDSGVGVEYWEMIVEIRLSEAPTVWEILRCGREEERLIPNYHGFIQRNDDGSETETKIDIN